MQKNGVVIKGIVRYWIRFRFGSILFYSVRFVSVRFDSVRFDSVLFGLVQFRFDSVLFDCVRFGPVQLGSVRLRSVWFCSVRFYSVRLCSVRFFSVWFISVRFDSVLFDSIVFDCVRFGSVRFVSISVESFSWNWLRTFGILHGWSFIGQGLGFDCKSLDQSWLHQSQVISNHKLWWTVPQLLHSVCRAIHRHGTFRRWNSLRSICILPSVLARGSLQLTN